MNKRFHSPMQELTSVTVTYVDNAYHISALASNFDEPTLRVVYLKYMPCDLRHVRKVCELCFCDVYKSVDYLDAMMIVTYHIEGMKQDRMTRLALLYELLDDLALSVSHPIGEGL